MVKEYCNQNEVNFTDLKPLLEKTLELALNKDPFMDQTGPAIRRDTDLIKVQIQDLKGYKDLEEIYEIFTKKIIKKHHNEL